MPESMRLSAFLTKTSVNLNILYKVMPLEMPDILNYLAATSVTGFLATDTEYAHNQTNVSEQVDVNSNVPDSQMGKRCREDCRTVARATTRTAATIDA